VGELGDRIDGARLDLIVVDSLQCLAQGARNTDEELSEAVRRLKMLAIEQHVAIFTTAQLPHLTARDDRRPQLDDFGALGAVKHHADVVLALFREDMYDRRREIEGATELLVRKNRNGGTGYVDLYFYAQWMRFEDMLDPER
jgi:replicative DNA helicase